MGKCGEIPRAGQALINGARRRAGGHVSRSVPECACVMD